MIKSDFRIIYMGTPDFAVAPLRALIEGGYNVVGVVTSVDRPAGRGQQLRPSAVKQYVSNVNLELTACNDQQIKLLQPEKLKDEKWLSELKELRADLFIVVAFRMLPEVVWSLPCYGTFNLHASLLPDYRGAAPINWAIINGETTTGVTTFFIDKDIDCGKIIDQRKVDITSSDNAGTLHDKLMVVGSDLVITTVDSILDETISTRPQPEVRQVKIAPKIFKDDCKIDWNASGIDIYNKIKGLAPYPAAWADLTDTLTAKVLEAHFEPDITAPTAGKLVVDGTKCLKISCNNGWIYIDTLHPQGKKAMNVEAFLRGYKF